jgi:renalase
VSVAVVGAGISGTACARALQAAGVEVTVLDRGRVPGGRMASRTIGGRRADTGASYLTARDERFVGVVEDWVARGLARPWTDTFHVATPQGLGERKSGPLRYGALGGLRSLVEDLLDGVPVRSSTTVGAVGPGPTVDGQGVDAVVLAVPDPQALRLLAPELTAERAALADRAWEPVLALVAGWDARGWDDGFDGCFVTDDGPDAVLGWIADDGRRRGDDAPVLVAHSSSAFAAEHLDDPEAATPALVAATSRVLGIDALPAVTSVHRWTYARPAEPRDEPCFLGAQRVGLCGDGWGSPRVETAYLSGRALGERLAAELSG